MNEPIRIRVTEAIGSDICVSSENGSKVFEKLTLALQTDRPIEVDFSGVQIVTAAFLNAAIGRLIQDTEKTTLEQRITYIGIAKEDQDLIDRVLENAVKFYSAPDQYRRALEINDYDA